VLACALRSRIVALQFSEGTPYLVSYRVDGDNRDCEYCEEIIDEAEFGSDECTALFPFSDDEVAVFTCSRGQRRMSGSYFPRTAAPSWRNRPILVYRYGSGGDWSQVVISGEGPPDIATPCQAILAPSQQAAYLFLDGLAFVYRLDIRARSWSRLKHPFVSPQAQNVLPPNSRAFLATDDVIGLLLPFTDGTEGYHRYFLSLATGKWRVGSRPGPCLVREDTHTRSAVTSVPSRYVILLGASCPPAQPHGSTIALANVDMLSLADVEQPTDPPAPVVWKRPRSGGAKLPASCVGAAVYHAPTDTIWLLAASYTLRVRSPVLSCSADDLAGRLSC
jgi:hypothetical protein